MKRFIVVLSLLSLVLIALVLFLINVKQNKPAKGPQILCDRQISEIAEIHITNQYDNYSVYHEGGGFRIASLPMDLVNPDYLLMLLDETAKVEYLQLVCRLDKSPAKSISTLAAYGLAQPIGTIIIRYTSGESLTLLFGNEESISRGQYFMTEGGDAVYLMDHSRVVRFLQPLKRFFNLEIVPVRSVPSPLSTIKNLTLSGRAFDKPIVISEVNANDQEDAREAISFGATTHMIKSPHLHKIDETEAIDVFGSLSGLLNIDVLDYNCSDAKLAEYGFNDPLVKAEYDYTKDKVSDPVKIVLKATMYQGNYIVVRDDERVVHRIEKKPFLDTSYEKLVSRWFLTPFITDVQSIDIRLNGNDHHLELLGKDNRSLEATLDSKKLDTDQFRKFYTLLVSASRDELLPKGTVPTSPAILTVTFNYRDPLKKPDTVSFSPGGLRRLYVTVNGLTEFSCLARYAQVTDAALTALAKGEDFTTDW